jgi:23S rRNA (uracil1939-C5)-methyltransferase
MRKKSPPVILEHLKLTDYAAEGKAMARIEGKVIFVSGAIPGDVVDVMLVKNKKDWAEARVLRIQQPSPDRLTPFCKHFGTCGGCKWQMLPYEKQLLYKQQEATENLRRIGKIEIPEFLPIIGSDDTTAYRNKLEFTFSNKRYLTHEEIGTETANAAENALGYHAPRIFDKIIDIQECHLMDEVNNKIRNTIRDYALLNKLEFYDIRNHTGWLRNIIIRFTSTGELMVNLCLNYEDEEERKKILDHILKEVPRITTLLYTINPKWNDTLYGLEPTIYSGNGYVMEKLEKWQFMIGPKSFFQTNTKQAEKLYGVVRDFAGLTGKEVVYDLYCGTGSIGIFLSDGASKLVGVEVVEEAIVDAKKNAALNNINHASFFAGDVIKICNDAFFETHGKPDVVITDPPRDGMHKDVIEQIMKIEPEKIVYVSCNSATQARDLALMDEKYKVTRVRPVDMFPQTHHVENVVLLEKR